MQISASVLLLLAGAYLALATTDGSQNLIPAFIREPRDTYVAAGKRTSLYCQAALQSTVNGRQTQSRSAVGAASQRAVYSWFVNGSLIGANRQRDFAVSNSQDQSTLTISNFRIATHQGRYQCLANYSFGSILSRPAFLRPAMAVLASEQSTPENTTVTMTVGNTAFIACQSPFNFSVPKAEVVGFEFNGAPLSLTQRHFITSDGNLVIASVQQADQGVYRCKVANALLEMVRFSRSSSVLRVVDPKRDKDGSASRHYALKVPQKDITTAVGQNVTIECVFVGMPPPRIVWEFTPAGDSPRQVTPGIGGVLQINNVQPEDAGVYSCSSIDSRVVPHYAQLIVNRPPQIDPENAFQLASARVGSRLELDCAAADATRWSWLHDGAPMANSGSSNSRTASGRLVIPVVGTQHAGVYQCMAENVNGMATKTIRVSVTAGSRNSYQITQATSNLSVSVDELAVFACVASGNSRDGLPSWSWLKDGRALPNDSRIAVEGQNDLTTSIQIFNVRQSDAGAYTCALFDGTAKNSRSTAWLAVESQPVQNVAVTQARTTPKVNGGRVPLRRRTTPAARTTASRLDEARSQMYIAVINSSSLFVTWTHAEAVASWLYGTAVLYRPANVSDLVERKFVTADVKQYVITGLLPDTAYEVWVVAQQQNGDKAPPSEVSVLRTLPVETAEFEEPSASELESNIEIDVDVDGEVDVDSERQTMEFDAEKYFNEFDRVTIGARNIPSSSPPAGVDQPSVSVVSRPVSDSESDSDSRRGGLDQSLASDYTLYIILVASGACILILLCAIGALLLVRARRYKHAKRTSRKSPSAQSRASDDNSILSYTKLPQNAVTLSASPACPSGFQSVNIGLLCDNADLEAATEDTLVLHAPVGDQPIDISLATDLMLPGTTSGPHSQDAYTYTYAGRTHATGPAVFVPVGDPYDATMKRTSIVLGGSSAAVHLVNNPFTLVGPPVAYRTLLPSSVGAQQPVNIAAFLSNIRPPSMAGSISGAPTRQTGTVTGSSASLSNASCSDYEYSREDINCNHEYRHGLPKSPRLDGARSSGGTQSSTTYSSYTNGNGTMRKRKHAKYRNARKKSCGPKDNTNGNNGISLNINLPSINAASLNSNLQT